MRVKCQPDGELPAGRKMIRSFAVHIPHPADTHKREYLLMGSFTGYCKGGIFYEESETVIHGLLA